jgi:hypothetical protein
MVRFTHRLLYPEGKSPRYPLDSRLGGPQSRSGHGAKRNIPSPRRKSNPVHPIVQPVASRYTDWAIPARSSRTCFGLNSSRKCPMNVCPKVNVEYMDIFGVLSELLRITGRYKIGEFSAMYTGVLYAGRLQSSWTQYCLFHFPPSE